MIHENTSVGGDSTKKMYSILGIFLVGCMVVGKISCELTIAEREAAVWARSQYENDTSIRNFTIQFNETMISDLKRRLNVTRRSFVKLDGIKWEYGLDKDVLESWITYWANTYNFTEREAFLNTYTHYLTNIQGLDIHFLHVKPTVTNCTVLPVLLLHGFPGSIREFYRTLPYLTTNCTNGVVLEIIAPSLPGFGFSDPAVYTEFGGSEIATVLKLLMFRLKIYTFYIQGGDWGAIIGGLMATLYPKVVLGYHTNFALSLSELTLATWFAASVNTTYVVDPTLESRMFPFMYHFRRLIAATGYLHMQSTKPDTLGIAMSYSPVSLLTYYLMLLSRGGIDLFTHEELLDNLMIFWMNNRFTTAARLYAESFNVRNIKEGIYSRPTTVPTRTIHAKNEIIYESPKILQLKFTNIQNSTALSSYGHFLAMEAPAAFAELVLTDMAGFYANTTTCSTST